MAVPDVIRTVLVVDDDEVFLRIFTHKPPQEVTFHVATESSAGIDLARVCLPDLAIVDLRIGSASGLDLIQALRTEQLAAYVVLVSAYASVDVTVRAMRAGADDVIEKPVTYQEVVYRLFEGNPGALDPISLDRAQWEHVQRVFADMRGNVSMTARKLGISRTTLHRLLRRSTPRR
jgi:two-component system, response regulator RegA